MTHELPITGVLFDLDGSLADTAGDLAAAINQTLREAGRQPIPHEWVRPHVSLGSQAMIEAAFPDLGADGILDAHKTRFLSHYRNRLAAHTRLFPGMDTVLARLDEHHIPWGIVTNKPGHLTFPLLEAMGLGHRAGVVVSGDCLPVAKPNPAPLLHAAAALGIEPASTLYVGDARRDIEAAVAAGMVPVMALYGYIHRDDDPAQWGESYVIEHPLDLLRWLP